MISLYRFACGVVLPFAIATSTCRSNVTICSAVYLRFAILGSSGAGFYSLVSWYKIPRAFQEGTPGAASEAWPLLKWLTKLCQHPHREQVDTEQRLSSSDDPYPADRFK